MLFFNLQEIKHKNQYNRPLNALPTVFWSTSASLFGHLGSFGPVLISSFCCEKRWAASPIYFIKCFPAADGSKAAAVALPAITPAVHELLSF